MNSGRFVVTSVVRRAGHTQSSGFVRVFEHASGRILMTSAAEESAHRVDDQNPRGGLRGARGVSAFGNRLVVANSERLSIFDHTWSQIGDITHPWFGSIHDILAEEDGIWVTSTSADLLLKMDWEGKCLESWEWRSDTTLCDRFGFTRLPAVDRKIDYRDPNSARDRVRDVIHLNSVSRCTEGLLLSFGRVLSPLAYRRQSVERRLTGLVRKTGLRRPRLRRRDGEPGKSPQARLFDVTRVPGSSWAAVLLRTSGSAEVLTLRQNVTVPNHNLMTVEDLIVFNDSNAGNLVGYSATAPDITVCLPGEQSFVRGLAHLNRRRFLVGNQTPAAIYEVDLDTGSITSVFSLDGEPNESPYGICLVPDSFDDPPANLFSKT